MVPVNPDNAPAPKSAALPGRNLTPDPLIPTATSTLIAMAVDIH
jgi:hypothetical protein